jgi:hypothetical protein
MATGGLSLDEVLKGKARRELTQSRQSALDIVRGMQ